MKRFKVVLLTVIAILAAIVILQNRQTMETHLLFSKVSMPRALLLALTLLVGFVAGVLVNMRLGTGSSDAKSGPA